MRNFSLFFAAASICLFACSASDEVAPTYEPLVCDPADAEHVAFAVQESAAWSGPYADKYYGRRFLIVDGSCRYFTNYGQFGEVRGGVLTSEDLAAINGELLTGAWESIDGEHRRDALISDSPTYSTWRDDLGGSCYANCDSASATLVTMQRIAFDWQTRLSERATPLEGAVQLVVSRESGGPYEGETEWAGATNISAALGEAFYGGVIDIADPADVAALRALRASLDSSSLARVQLREGDVSYLAVVLDVMPHANADGRFLPPFPIMSYGP